VGVSKHAQAQLGDVVFVSLPVPGRKVAKGAELAVVESVKTAADVYAPLTGTVFEINLEVADKPALVNADPLGEGWLFRLKVGADAELTSLLSEHDYQATLDDNH
jgi:glycine cleavage system H protein